MYFCTKNWLLWCPETRKAVIEESLVRKDLMRCIQDNKQATRKLTLGNISVEK